jgi:hypothetical protein
VGGSAVGNSNGGNGGDGGNASITSPTFGGSTTSGNSATVGQTTDQAIVVVPVSVQLASARYSALSHALAL